MSARVVATLQCAVWLPFQSPSDDMLLQAKERQRLLSAELLAAQTKLLGCDDDEMTAAEAEVAAIETQIEANMKSLDHPVHKSSAAALDIGRLSGDDSSELTAEEKVASYTNQRHSAFAVPTMDIADTTQFSKPKPGAAPAGGSTDGQSSDDDAAGGCFSCCLPKRGKTTSKTHSSTKMAERQSSAEFKVEKGAGGTAGGDRGQMESRAQAKERQRLLSAELLAAQTKLLGCDDDEMTAAEAEVAAIETQIEANMKSLDHLVHKSSAAVPDSGRLSGDDSSELSPEEKVGPPADVREIGSILQDLRRQRDNTDSESVDPQSPDPTPQTPADDVTPAQISAKSKLQIRNSSVSSQAEVGPGGLGGQLSGQADVAIKVEGEGPKEKDAPFSCCGGKTNSSKAAMKMGGGISEIKGDLKVDASTTCGSKVNELSQEDMVNVKGEGKQAKEITKGKRQLVTSPVEGAQHAPAAASLVDEVQDDDRVKASKLNVEPVAESSEGMQQIQIPGFDMDWNGLDLSDQARFGMAEDDYIKTWNGLDVTTTIDATSV